MLGISVTLGGVGIVCCGQVVHKWSQREAFFARKIEDSPDETLQEAAVVEHGAAYFAVVSGRTGTYDSQVLQSKMGQPCVRVHRTSEAEYERWNRDTTSGTWSSHKTRELLTSGDAGGSVAIEPFTGTAAGRVVLRHSLDNLWTKDDETYTPGWGGAEHADKLLGVRATERVILSGRPVSAAGLVERQLCVSSVGPPHYCWVLLPADDPRVARANVPTLVVPGSKADLVRAQHRKADNLDTLQWGLTALGTAAVLGGLFQAQRDLSKPHQGK